MRRKSGSEDTLFRMLVKARQEPLTVTALALALHTVKGLRRSGPGARCNTTAFRRPYFPLLIPPAPPKVHKVLPAVLRSPHVL